MSIDNAPGPNQLEPHGLGDDVAVVRRYRFGFRHAAALTAAVVLVVAASSSLWSIAQFAIGGFSEPREPDAVSFPDVWHDQPSVDDELFAPPDAERDLWASARGHAYTIVWAFRQALDEARLEERARALNETFAALNQSDPRAARAFLAAYKKDPDAVELGYVAAVERAISERRFYRPADIVKCGKCWCYRESPAAMGDGSATQ